MKKLITSALLAIVLMVVAATSSFAATNADLIEYLTSNHTIAGQSVGLTAENRVKVERYLTENPATDDQAAQVMAKGDELIALMNEAGTADPTKLSSADKQRFMAIANEAAAILGLTLVFHPDSVDVYKDGVLLDTMTLGSITTGNGKLVYTGNDINLALVISSVAIIALAAGVVAKKRLANA